MKLAASVHRFCRTLPRNEQFALASQMWRAAISVPSNIAEGAARGTRKEFLQFVIIARGSLSELETQLLLAADVGYVDRSDNIFVELDQTSRLLSGLKNHPASGR